MDTGMQRAADAATSVEADEDVDDAATSVTVIVCEDEDLARQTLTVLLEESLRIKVIASCASRAECLRAIEGTAPQVLITDLRLGGNTRGGIELIRQTRNVSPATLCLVLTATDGQGEMAPEAFLSGAHGYYRKGYVTGPGLPNLILRLAAGQWEIEPSLAAQLLRLEEPHLPAAVRAQRVTEASPPGAHGAGGHDPGVAARCRDETLALNPVELAVLRKLADGTAPHEIAHQLGLSTGSVSTYIHNITEKAHQRYAQGRRQEPTLSPGGPSLRPLPRTSL